MTYDEARFPTDDQKAQAYEQYAVEAVARGEYLVAAAHYRRSADYLNDGSSARIAQMLKSYEAERNSGVSSRRRP